ncbi:MAG TPA: hypothetical protein VFC02_17040 [Anaerolineales bacterium]|jgi:hypothetical protein|nr:hypothetical protein [Anaerolineales bacterium]
MSNFRDILLQIIDVLGIQRQWKEREVDDFLAIAEVEAMVDLIEPLPKDKRSPILKEIVSPANTSQKVEQMLSPYYTHAQMQAAVVTRMKKQIAQHIVKLVEPPPTPAQREKVLVLLEKLSFRN